VSVQAPPGRNGLPDGGPTSQSANERRVRRRRNASLLGFIASSLVGVAFVAYAVVISQQVPTSRYANLVIYASPKKAPGFDLPPLGAGTRVTSEALGARPTVMEWFWSGCPACQRYINTFASVARQEHSKVHFLGVDVYDPSPSTALMMVRRAKADYPVAEAPGIGSMSLATGFGVGDYPDTVFVSGRRILGEVLGIMPRAELVVLVDNLAAGRPLNS